MASPVAVLESAAITLIKRAIELDQLGRYTESLTFYESGIQEFIKALRSIQDETRRTHYRKKVEEYMNRAEKIKEQVQKEKEAGKYHEQIHISARSTGHSYEKIFGKFLDASATRVDIEDPYIRSHHQIVNFLRFCEMLIASAANIQHIHLVTGAEDVADSHQIQRAKLDEIAKSLANFNIQLHIEYSTTLHDREIRFNNGWIIKIGRGLDFFKAAPGKFAVGQYDMNYRPCHETTIDIFHQKHTKPS